MFFLMLDTCVWINFLERANLKRSLEILEELIAEDVVRLWITDEIRTEFNEDRRNKVRKDGAEKSVLDAIRRRLNVKTDKEMVEAISKIIENPQVYNRADQIEQDLIHIDDMFDRSCLIEGSDDVERRVYSRIRQKLAPFHRKSKDAYRCLNDCVIIEKFASASALLLSEDDFSIFVSSDNEAYAKARDLDESHPDYENIFADQRVFFTRSIEQAVDVIRESVTSWQMPRKFRHSNRKSWNEIVAEIAVVGDHNWVHRHLAFKSKIEDGTFSLRPGRSVVVPARPRKAVGIDSWREQLVIAEQKLASNPGLPITTDPFQAGFAAGALNALRWVQGEELPPSNAMRRPSTDLDDEVAGPRDTEAA